MSQSPLVKPEIPSGVIIDNRYIIQQLLGHGGLGRTYLAFDTRRFNEPCVLKEFAPIGSGENALEKCRNLFKREAKILHQLEHPQIPRFLACFEGEGRLFLVQEFVNGKTYSALLRERQSQGQVFSEQEVIHWLKKLLPVLEYVHHHKIIHRDISPDNIMLPQGSDIPVLIDFGVGKQLADLHEATTLNSNMMFVGKMSLVGKVGYAPREQISLGLCSNSSDLYALGVTAIVLLTGKDPSFLMDQYSLEWKWHHYANVSNGFIQILNKMLADTPKMRYQTSTEVLADLKHLEKTQLVSASTIIDLPPTIVETEYKPAIPKFNSRKNDISSVPQENEHLGIRGGQAQRSKEEEVTKIIFQREETNMSSPLSQHTRQPQQKSFLTIEFLRSCQEKLAYHIGPMASLIVEEVLAQNAQISPYEFIELLAKEIPDPQAAYEFRRSLFS